MEYRCQDIGMIRCAAVHKGIFEFLLCDDFDINKTVEFALGGNLGIKPDYLKMAIRVASESLYESLNNYEVLKHDKKKNRQINVALYKYLVRMASRAVPFGLFSSVGLFEFGTKNHITFDNKVFNYSTKLDKEWLNKFFYNLEMDECNFENLKLYLNDNIYCIGNTYKNPYHSAFGLQKDLSGPEMVEFSVTRAFLLAVPLLKRGVDYKDLHAMFKENYPNVTDEIVRNMLRKLIDMEFVYTNFRPFAYMNDEDILSLLVGCEDNKKILIGEIIEELAFIEENGSLIYENLNKVIDKMKSINTSQNYLKVDKGLKFFNNKVDDKLKSRVEKFVNIISKIPLKTVDDGLNSIINCFLDRVGYDVLVPLTMAIDSTRFGIMDLDNTKPTNDMGFIDGKFRSMIDEKIQISLMKNEDYITVSEDEIDNLQLGIDRQLDEKNWVNSMDLAFIVTGKEGEEELYLSPNIGSSKMGNYFQRFSDVFDSNIFAEFLYNYEENTSNTEIKTIEAFEMEKIGHVNNICKNQKRYENSISLGYRSYSEASEIKLSDLYLFVSSKNSKLYIYCKKLNSVCRIIADDMLNYESNGKVLKLLKKISYHYEDYKVVERLASLYANSYIYVPRILIEGICVSGRKWKLSSELIRNDSKELFEIDFKKYCKKLNVPNVVYIEQYDNRLLVNLKNEGCLMILYNSFKANGYLLISEIENKMMEDSIVRDIEGNAYNTELVFSLRKEMGKVESKNFSVENLSYLEEEDLLFHPFEKGWLYIKIYGISKHNENKVLADIFKFNQSYIKLLLGLYKDYEGIIKINGRYNLKDLDMKCYREKLSVLFQNFIKWEDSLVNNLKYDLNFDGEIEEVKRDLEHLNIRIDNNIQLSQIKLGFLFDEGIQLSGGEWQKIANLRALSKTSDIYIFDELNSSLDSISEKNLSTLIQKKLEKKGVIIIAHKFKRYAEISDNIYILDNGRIVGEGTHDYLYKNNGYYRNYYSDSWQ